jgi:polyketide cyclase/dehydrase/lipid transport protein
MASQMVVERGIVVAVARPVVFDFVSDFRNDPRWRSEVNRMEMVAPLDLGDIATEYSTLFGKEVVTPTVVVEKDAPRIIRVQTPTSFPHYLESVRIVEPVDAGTSRFRYRLTSDGDFLADVLPELPPADELSAAYGPVLEKYLATLKELLETAAR